MPDTPRKKGGDELVDEELSGISPVESEAELDRVVSFETVESIFVHILNDRYTQLLTAGLRYPLTNTDPLKTLVLGGFLLLPLMVAVWLSVVEPQEYTIPFLLSLASVPVMGYLIYVVQRSANGNHELESFPRKRDRITWKKLCIVGSKGLLIITFCLLAPLAFLSGFMGGVTSGVFNSILELTPRQYAKLIISVGLICVYPALIGSFVETGRVSSSVNSTKRPLLLSRRYLRGITVILTLVVATGALIDVAFGIFGINAWVVIGPGVFYALVSIHHVIGLTWREANSETSDELPRLPIFIDRSSRTEPVSEALGQGINLDLHEISKWEVRTRFDRFAVHFYEVVRTRPFLLLALYLMTILVFQLITTVTWWHSNANQYRIGMYFLSIIPAIVIALYICNKYRTANTPFRPIMITFLLGAAVAPAVFYISNIFIILHPTGAAGIMLSYFLFFAPLQETGKLLAVRLYVYRSRYFNTVIDGAVYGAAAGLGFAVMLNGSWLMGPEQGNLMDNFVILAVVSPVQVLFTAFTGYYLGLAKYNAEFAGPIVIKAVFIIVVLRSIYGTIVDLLYMELSSVPTGIGIGNQKISLGGIIVIGIAVVFISLVAVMVRHRLASYDDVYRRVNVPLEASYSDNDSSDAGTSAYSSRVEPRSLRQIGSAAVDTLRLTLSPHGVASDDTSTRPESAFGKSEKGHVDKGDKTRIEELRKLHEAGLLTDTEFEELSGES